TSGLNGLAQNGVTYDAAGAIAGDSSATGVFNGSTSYIWNDQLKPAPDTYTIETWIKTDTTQGGKIVGYGNGRPNTGTQATNLSGTYDRQVYMDNTGRITFGVWAESAQAIRSSGQYNDNQWHHIVATQSPSGMVLYIDGAAVGQNPTTAGQPYWGVWHIGGDQLSSVWPNVPASKFFQGQIDETAIYQLPLTARQVAEHYRLGGRTVIPPGPLLKMVAGSPTIRGTAQVGIKLTSAPGTWVPASPAFTYQWAANGTAISGATGTSYTPTAADAGKTLTITYTGKQTGYVTTLATSAATKAVAKAKVSVARLVGVDRFETAIQVAHAYTPGVDRVYLANGLSYADALSAAPAAANFGAPVLLTTLKSLPGDVKTELQRLKPKKIIVIGGAGAITDAQVSTLKDIAPVQRLAGTDRYATSQAVARDAFGTGANTAYITTGMDFPDALAAAPAAAHFNGPVILVPGKNTSLDAATTKLVKDLGVKTAKIAGGTAIVSSGIQSALKSQLGAGNVQRLFGTDRYATAAKINLDAFTKNSTAYLASGSGYADALVGAALAGKTGAPLYLAHPNCVPASALTGIERIGATKIILFGGSAVVDAKVESLTACT
uniref:cell wall-binding repeat-containing protein n=1 Tax=Homoserinimonas sp. OAct 916 TaxID=2211450 RepID=UPI0018E59981